MGAPAAAQDGPLSGRTALVTGAGRGLGRGAAVGIARRGATVIAVARTLEELERTAAMAPAGRILPTVADLASPAAVDALVDRVVAEHGPVEVLINNAAMLPFEPFERTTPALWQEVLQVNLHAAYQLAWRCYPAMVERGRGVIHNVSSGAGVRPFVLETAYCASKYALEGLTKSLALEAMPHGVAVTLSSPGRPSKPTSLTEKDFLALDPAVRARYADDLDVAEAFAWLAETVDNRLNGRRFDLHGLAALVRERGWGLSAIEAIQRVERSA